MFQFGLDVCTRLTWTPRILGLRKLFYSSVSQYIIIIIVRTRSRQRTITLSILHDHQLLSRPLVQLAVRP